MDVTPNQNEGGISDERLNPPFPFNSKWRGDPGSNVQPPFPIPSKAKGVGGADQMDSPPPVLIQSKGKRGNPK